MDVTHGDFVSLAFRGVLRREPTNAERSRLEAALSAGTSSQADVLRELVECEEYGAVGTDTYREEDDPRLRRFRTGPIESLSRRLRDDVVVPQEHFDAVWSDYLVELGDGPGEQVLKRYGEEHRRRFHATVNAMQILLEGREAPRVLDFGVSVFTPMIKRIVPQVELVTSDRPTDPDQEAYFRRVSAYSGASAHVAIDLAEPEFLTAENQAAIGEIDFIIFTEVLEHLPSNPVRVLEQLIRLLSPDGQLYVTTPNCFARRCLDAIRRRVNPQQVFPYEGNPAGVHHYRELPMAELLVSLVEAGGQPIGFYYSDCWDDDEIFPRDQRSCLVATAKRGT